MNPLTADEPISLRDPSRICVRVYISNMCESRVLKEAHSASTTSRLLQVQSTTCKPMNYTEAGKKTAACPESAKRKLNVHISQHSADSQTTFVGRQTPTVQHRDISCTLISQTASVIIALGIPRCSVTSQYRSFPESSDGMSCYRLPRAPGAAATLLHLKLFSLLRQAASDEVIPLSSTRKK